MLNKLEPPVELVPFEAGGAPNPNAVGVVPAVLLLNRCCLAGGCEVCGMVGVVDVFDVSPNLNANGDEAPLAAGVAETGVTV